MAEDYEEEGRRWAQPFLDALKTGNGIAAAARSAGITTSTAYKWRTQNARFRGAWQAIGGVDGRTARRSAPRRKRGTARLDRFLVELAETSNVSAAAALAELSVSAVYKLRREDPDFARRWFAALAEGYDNLEMELLGRLRAGDAADKDAGRSGNKLDTAAALRCLAAHRESVAREKGRRALAEEAITIASINAKIDQLRLNRDAGARAMLEARRAKARLVRDDGGLPSRPDG